MTEKVLYWSTLVASVLGIVFFSISAALISGNQSLQDEIGRRQNIINTARAVAPLNQQLSQALYDLSVSKQNKKIQDLLVSQGFRLPENSPAAKPSAKAPVAER